LRAYPGDVIVPPWLIVPPLPIVLNLATGVADVAYGAEDTLLIVLNLAVADVAYGAEEVAYGAVDTLLIVLNLAAGVADVA